MDLKSCVLSYIKSRKLKKCFYYIFIRVNDNLHKKKYVFFLIKQKNIRQNEDLCWLLKILFYQLYNRFFDHFLFFLFITSTFLAHFYCNFLSIFFFILFFKHDQSLATFYDCKTFYFFNYDTLNLDLTSCQNFLFYVHI